jgi:hypothetical protein
MVGFALSPLTAENLSELTPEELGSRRLLLFGAARPLVVPLFLGRGAGVRVSAEGAGFCWLAGPAATSFFAIPNLAPPAGFLVCSRRYTCLSREPYQARAYIAGKGTVICLAAGTARK